MSSKLNIVVAGYVVRYPLGGQAWAHLQYVFGFKRLGHDVFFFEDAGWPDSCYDPSRGISSDDPEYGIQFLGRIMRRYGLGDSWVYCDSLGHFHGPAPSRFQEMIRGDFVLIDLSAVSWLDAFEQASRKIYIDEDPAFPQFALAGGDEDLRMTLCRYDVHFSYGRNIGKPYCTIPSAGLDWLPTSPPIAADLWKISDSPPGAPYTTIMNWTSYANVEFQGETYGQKDVEFEKVIDLPEDSPAPLEVALGGAGAPEERLQRHGWVTGDPLKISRSMDSYRRYIYGSAGEFSVAKNAYVKTRSGWFSDRSAAYLAAGRPVVIQNTGFSDWIDASGGIVPFGNLEEAREGLCSVVQDWQRHSRRARELALEHFDSRKVLRSLLERGGI